MSEKEISEKMQDIMKRMKTRREELNMSYQTLSEKVGISKSVDKLEEIADALSVSPAYLMGWESSKPITMAAHLDGKDFTKEQWSRIESFAKFVKQEDTKQIP